MDGRGRESLSLPASSAVRRRSAWWRWRTHLAGFTSLVLVATLSEQPALAVPEAEWVPPAPPGVRDVPVTEVAAPAPPTVGGELAAVSGDQPVSWPAAGSHMVTLPAGSLASAGTAAADGAPSPWRPGRAQAGALPVRIGAAPLQPVRSTMPGAVRLELADRAATHAAGVSGLLLGAARADGRALPADVAVEVDYSGFRHAYGGDWATRLRAVMVTDCSQSSLAAAETCRTATPLPTSNDYRTGVLAARVPLPAGSGTVLVAISAGPGGDNGDYTATSLSPAATWQVSQQTGSFGWSYPLRMVPGMGGPEPPLSLSYSSQAVDGLTANTNTQGSWIGDGWDLWPGYIERSYRTCALDDDPIGGQEPNNANDPTGDMCWVSDNATMSLNGKATELVPDGNGRYKGVTDDGSRIERLTDPGLSNGDPDGEYWRVTTLDGVQYFFGRHRRPAYPADTAATGSTWTVPVYGNHPGEPCHEPDDFAGSRCTQAWRWNLDYVVDPSGNSMTLFYAAETGAYGREEDPALRTTYDRGGYLERIDYGTRSGQEHTQPVPARVRFDVVDRCKPGATCDPDTPSSWPDVPWDQYCDETPCTDQALPTFWTQKRLAKIRTQVWRGSGHTDVESWTLEHKWLDAGDSDGEAIPMWLHGITRTGHVTTAGGVQTAEPQIRFDPGSDPLANRVKDPLDGRSALNRWRVRGIFTESGAYLGVGYSAPECDPDDPPTPHTNDQRCFPQWYAPPGVWVEPTLDWFHKYVVEQVDVHDLTGASPSQRTTYQYLDDPAWRYADSRLVPADKRTWSVWRGYSEVRVIDGLPGETRSRVDYLYLRGMHGDRANADGGTKTVEVTDSQGVAITDHEAHAGFLREQTVYNGPSGEWVSGTINTPWRHGPTATSGPLKAYLTNTEVARNRTSLATGGTRWTRTTTTFDTTYGLPTRVNDEGDEAITADDICIRHEYARNTPKWIIDRVSRTERVGVRCAATPARPADVLSDTRTFYDDATIFGAAPTRGLPVRTDEVGDWTGSTPHWVTTARTTFDSHGREVESFDALDRRTATAFTPATGGPVTSSVTTNPAGHATTTTLEPGWNVPTATVDANGRMTDRTYDGLGRVTAVWLPGRDRATQIPNLRFTYLLRNDAPTVVTIHTLLPTGTTYRTSISLLDGTMRQRQTQSQAPGGGRVIEDTGYDARGLVEWESKPYFNSGAPSTTLVGTAGQPQIPGLTQKLYDGAERVRADIFKANGVEAWRTSYDYGGDRTHTTPPVGGTATTTITDARDQTVALRQYHGPTPTGDHDQTSYTYTGRGEIESVTDPAGNTWTYEYDQRGRRVVVVDPDVGTVTNDYDDAGQVTTTADARGVTLGFTYDTLGRRLSVRTGSQTGPIRAEWVYDTLAGGLGKLTRSIRHDGGAQYVNEVVGYDPAGQATGNRIIIPAGETGLAGTYTTAITYRPDGSVATTTLPAAGGLPQERLVFSYDDVGNPTGLTSPWGLYTNSVTYNSLSELTQRVLGQHGKRLSLTYLYDEPTGRLLNVSAVPELNPELTDRAFSYDETGNLLRIADSPGSATPTDTQCFRYDQLRRLTAAWTPVSGSSTNCAADPSTGALGGPAPYWQSWTHASTGNRLTQTLHTSGGDTTTAYGYPTAGSPRPHAVTEATTAGPTGTRLDTFGYDAAGNMTERTLAGETQTLTFDAEGGLAGTEEESGETSYLYDADGERLIRRDPTGATLYLPSGQELRYDSATATVTCTRYYTHVDTAIAVRTPTQFSWLVADRHNTAEIAVRSTDLQAQHRRMLPFGEPRGAEPAWWPGDKGFVGGTQDPTGLTHIGARLYDPSLGRFISVDPLADHLDPQQMNGYIYGNNAPPSFIDPDGLFWGEVGKGLFKGWQQVQQAPIQFVAQTYQVVEANVSAAASGEQSWGDAFLNWQAYQGTATIEMAACIVTCAISAVENTNAAIEAGQRGDWESAAESSYLAAADAGAVASFFIPGGALSRFGGIRPRPPTRPVTCANSFVPGTPVVLADGSHVPIEDVEIGEEVIATDPETGETSAETVVATIIGEGDKTLVDITIAGKDEPGEASSTITATGNHPIWVTNRGNGEWVDAADLTAGDSLWSREGSIVGVAAATVYEASSAVVYNLTVANVHTYHVTGGDASVLVHNCAARPEWIEGPVPLENTVRRHHRWAWLDKVIYNRTTTRHLSEPGTASDASQIGQQAGGVLDNATGTAWGAPTGWLGGLLYGWARGLTYRPQHYVNRRVTQPQYRPGPSSNPGRPPQHRGEGGGSGGGGGPGSNYFV